MGKIISIRNSFIAVRKDDGKIEMVSRSDCDFEPIVGEEVEIISDGSKTVLRRKNSAMVPSESMEEKNQEKSDDFKKTNNPEPTPQTSHVEQASFSQNLDPFGRIIDIEDETVFIGKKDSSIQRVLITSCKFKPEIGDEVEIFSDGTKIIVAKKNLPQASDKHKIKSTPEGRVLSINGDQVIVGKKDGSFQEVPIWAFQFDFDIGDEVDVFSEDNKLIVLKKKEASQAPINVRISAPNSVATYRVSKTAQVKKSTYFLCALPGGWFGLHKFYEGKFITGLIIMLLVPTKIVPIFAEILAIIEAMGGLNKPTDKDGYVWK